MVTLFRDRLVKEQEHSWMPALMRSDVEEANIRYFNAIERAEDNNDFLGVLFGIDCVFTASFCFR